MHIRAMRAPGLFRLVLAVIAAMATASALAQEAYPDKTVRVIAASPGGNPDLLARLLAQKLTTAFGQPFVVENMPGAGGSMVPRFVASARADGYVIGLGDSGSLAINFALKRKPELRSGPGFHADHSADQRADHPDAASVGASEGRSWNCVAAGESEAWRN